MTTVLLMLVGSAAVLAGYMLGRNHVGRRAAPVPCASKLSLDHRAAVVGSVPPRRGSPLTAYPCELAAGHLGPHKHGQSGTATGEVTWW